MLCRSASYEWKFYRENASCYTWFAIFRECDNTDKDTGVKYRAWESREC